MLELATLRYSNATLKWNWPTILQWRWWRAEDFFLMMRNHINMAIDFPKWAIYIWRSSASCYPPPSRYLCQLSGLSEPGSRGPQILADQLTLSQPGPDHTHHITTCPSHRIFRLSYGPDYSPDWKCWSARVAKGLTIDYIYENRSNINCADYWQNLFLH